MTQMFTFSDETAVYFSVIYKKVNNKKNTFCLLLNHTGTQDSSSYVPSADALAKIESAGFTPEAFVSHNSNKVGRNIK